MSFIVIQIVPGVNPDDPCVPKGLLTGTGVLVPVSCDGFYNRAEDAHDIAAWLSTEFPKLQTIVASVTVANDPEELGESEFPPLPRHENEAPPAYTDKAAERAKMTPRLRYSVIKRDGYRCRACGASVQDGARLHVDHIEPVSRGGRTVTENLQTLCASCNAGKGAS